MPLFDPGLVIILDTPPWTKQRAIRVADRLVKDAQAPLDSAPAARAWATPAVYGRNRDSQPGAVGVAADLMRPVSV